MRGRLVVALAAAMIVAGCGTSEDHSQHQDSSSRAASSATTPASPGLVVDVKIAAGAVTPTNAQFTAKRGEPIQLRVSSDAPDELHVHSVPEHSFAVEAKPDQQFTFTVDVPGRVDVELHKLDRVVATIAVQQ